MSTRISVRLLLCAYVDWVRASILTLFSSPMRSACLAVLSTELAQVIPPIRMARALTPPTTSRSVPFFSVAIGLASLSWGLRHLRRCWRLGRHGQDKPLRVLQALGLRDELECGVVVDPLAER